MTIIVFLFCYRGEFGEFESGFEFECEFELEIGTGMFGSVDLGGSTTRCQCYQHKWLFLLVVMYSTILYYIVNMNIYCNIINVIRK